MHRRVFAAAAAAWLLALGSAGEAQWRPGGVMRIVLLVDSSSSVAPMITPMRAGLNAFLDGLPPSEAEIVFISTGGQLRVRVPPTSDRDKIREAVNRFASDGGANSFLETLLESDERFLRKADDRRSVFVILTTDAGIGINQVRTDAYNKFARDFIQRGGRAHAIVVRGLNTGSTSIIAENLTENTGGFYDAINVASAIPKVMRTLTEYVAADQ